MAWSVLLDHSSVRKGATFCTAIAIVIVVERRHLESPVVYVEIACTGDRAKVTGRNRRGGRICLRLHVYCVQR